MEDTDRSSQECLAFLKSEPIYRRMLDGFVKKYESYGEVCGSVKLPLRSREDVSAMEGFLQKPLQGHKSVSVSAAALRKALADSRFAKADPDRLLNIYAGGNIEVRSQEKKREAAVYRETIREYAGQTSDPVAGGFFSDLLQAAGGQELQKTVSGFDKAGNQSLPAASMETETKHVNASRRTGIVLSAEPDAGLAALSEQPETEIVYERPETPAFSAAQTVHRMFIQQYRILWQEEKEQAVSWLHHALNLAADILKTLPVRSRSYQCLAVFAADRTGDPHAFDRGTRPGALLEKILLWYEETCHPKPQSFSLPDVFASVRRGRLFLTCGILVDDVSNYVTLYHVYARKEDGKPDLGMEGFQKERAVVQVPLSVITRWTLAGSDTGTILIVENPSIFSILVSRYPERSFLCMNGQPRLAGLLMLRLLLAGGTEISYGGDLDPEGIRIADRLWEFSGKKLRLWHMSPEDYLGHIKQAESQTPLSQRRLRILEKIEHPVLKRTAREVRKYKLAVYQENLLADGLEAEME